MADWSDLEFNASDINYIYQLDTLRDRSEAVATEVEDARLGEASLDITTGNLNTELVAAREGEASLVANLQTNYISKSGGNLDLVGGKLINVGNGTANTDTINLGQATSILDLGAIPSDVEITDLGRGTATVGQRYVAGPSGSPVGEDNEILTLDVGTLGSDEAVGSNTAGTALEAKDLTNISTGLTPSSLVQTKSDGTGLEDYDNDLEVAMSNLFFYNYKL